MPRHQVQKSENQFAVLMDNKYMKATVNPYPTIGGGSTSNKKNIGDWGNKNSDVYKAPHKVVPPAVEEISSPVTQNIIKKSLLIPRTTQSTENIDEKISADSDEE